MLNSSPHCPSLFFYHASLFRVFPLLTPPLVLFWQASASHERPNGRTNGGALKPSKRTSPPPPPPPPSVFFFLGLHPFLLHGARSATPPIPPIRVLCPISFFGSFVPPLPPPPLDSGAGVAKSGNLKGERGRRRRSEENAGRAAIGLFFFSLGNAGSYSGSDARKARGANRPWRTERGVMIRHKKGRRERKNLNCPSSSRSLFFYSSWDPGRRHFSHFLLPGCCMGGWDDQAE